MNDVFTNAVDFVSPGSPIVADGVGRLVHEVPWIKFEETGVVVNADNGDRDFRVQGKNTKYLCATDADANDFGVGGSKFGTRLLVTGAMVVVNEQGADIDFRAEGDTCTHLLYAEANANSENVAFCAASQPIWQGMDRGMFIGDAEAVPTGVPFGGGFLYVQDGALRWRGSSGTDTEIGPA